MLEIILSVFIPLIVVIAIIFIVDFFRFTKKFFSKTKDELNERRFH